MSKKDHESAADAYRKAIDAKQRLIAFLRRLPKGAASDLVELFKQHAETDDPCLRQEIAETISEILIPEVLLVEIRKEYDLDHEGKSVL